MKKICLFAISIASLAITFLHTNNSNLSKVTNQSIVKKAESYVNESIQMPTIVSEDNTNIDSLMTKYNFYLVNGKNYNFIVADTYNEYEKNFILEFKLILSTDKYSFYGFESLREKDAVIEIIKRNSNTNDFTKEYIVPSNFQVNYIKNKSLLCNDETIKSRLISSINIENDFKAQMNNNSNSMITRSASSNINSDVDNQTVLDFFLDSDAIFSAETIELGFTGGSQEVIQSYDDCIVNLIPKDVFITNGTYSKSGSEWGFFAKTYDDYGDNKITSLIIFDIINVKTDGINPDYVQVIPKIHRNYKYDYDTNVVVSDVDNNYCIGNPYYKASLNYVKFDNDLNGVEHPNPTDDDYTVQDDYGYCFGSTSVKYIGVGKNSDGNIGLAKLLLQLSNIGVDIVTSGLSIVEQLAIGMTCDFIGNSVVDALTESTKNLNFVHDTQTDKYIYSATNLSGFSNFNLAKQNSMLTKYYEVKMPGYDSSFNSNNRQTPLLFKNDTDSVNYEFQLYSSEYSDDYTALVSHKLNFDVFNDNSTRLFKRDPDFLGTVESNWSYLIGQDIHSNSYLIDNGKSDYYVASGTVSDQVVQFRASAAGKYRFVLENIGTWSKIQSGNYSDSSGSTTFINCIGTTIYASNKDSIYIDRELEEDELVDISISRVNQNNFKLFGTAKLRVFYVKEDVIVNFSNLNSKNFYSKTIASSGFNVLNKINVLHSGYYTFNVSSANSSYRDTYMTFLDDKFRKIISDDDSFGNMQAGFGLFLSSYKTYYVLTSFYSTSTQGEYKLNISRQRYLPELRGRVCTQTIHLAALGSNRQACFLTRQSQTRTIRFSLSWENNQQYAVSLNVYNSEGSVVYSSSNINSSTLTVELAKNNLYMFYFSVSSSAISGIGANIYNSNV